MPGVVVVRPGGPAPASMCVGTVTRTLQLERLSIVAVPSRAWPAFTTRRCFCPVTTRGLASNSHRRTVSTGAPGAGVPLWPQPQLPQTRTDAPTGADAGLTAMYSTPREKG